MTNPNATYKPEQHWSTVAAHIAKRDADEEPPGSSLDVFDGNPGGAHFADRCGYICTKKPGDQESPIA
jgi:hypothetical protein